MIGRNRQTLALAFCILAGAVVCAQDRLVPPGSPPASRIEPNQKPEATVKPEVAKDSTTVSPGGGTTVVESTPIEEYRPSFSERMAGFREALFHPISFSWFTDWAGANNSLLAGDIEDPYWLRADMFFGWFKRPYSPPLLTTGTPQESRGIIGNDGTSVLYGDGNINLLVHYGGRVTFGFWLEPSQALGFEGSYFFLAGRKALFEISSKGDPLLAAPYFDAIADQQSSLVLANDTLNDQSLAHRNGAVEIGWSSRMHGAELNFVHNLVRGSRARIDWSWGYRYLRFDESLYQSVTIAEDPPAGQQFGTETHLFDKFDTENDFNGINFGVRSQWWWGCWSLDVNGKLALGATRSTIQIFGQKQQAAPPQFQVVTTNGGIYALGSNIGDETFTSFGFIPEIEVGLGYQWSDHVKLNCSWDLLGMNRVYRPGDQIDVRINPNILDGNSGNPAQPERLRNSTSLWVQTLTFGVEYRW